MLIATDLPEPVVPATSRCGILARSTITGSPPIVLPSAMASLCLRVLEILARQQLAQVDRLAPLVGQLDADRVAALHDRDAGRDRRHRARDVVGEADHARGFDAGRRLEFVERDDRAGAHVDDLALDAEIVEHAFEQPRVLLQRVLGDFRGDRLLRLGEHRQRRQFVGAAVEQRQLRFACGAAAGLQRAGAAAASAARARRRSSAAPRGSAAARCASPARRVGGKVERRRRRARGRARARAAAGRAAGAAGLAAQQPPAARS